MGNKGNKLKKAAAYMITFVVTLGGWTNPVTMMPGGFDMMVYAQSAVYLENGVLNVNGEGEVSAEDVNEAIGRQSVDSEDYTVNEVVIGADVTGIGDKAFYNLKSCKKLTIPGNVEKIGQLAFANMSSLETVISNSNAPAVDLSYKESDEYKEDSAIHDEKAGQSMWFLGDNSIKTKDAVKGSGVASQLEGCHTEEYTAKLVSSESQRYFDAKISDKEESICDESGDASASRYDNVSVSSLDESEYLNESKATNTRYTGFSDTESYSTSGPSSVSRYGSMTFTGSSDSSYTYIFNGRLYRKDALQTLSESTTEMTSLYRTTISAYLVYTNIYTNDTSTRTISATGTGVTKSISVSTANQNLNSAVSKIINVYMVYCTCTVTGTGSDKYTGTTGTVTGTGSEQYTDDDYNLALNIARNAAYSCALSKATSAASSAVYYTASASCTMKTSYTDNYDNSTKSASFTGSSGTKTALSTSGLLDSAKSTARANAVSSLNAYKNSLSSAKYYKASSTGRVTVSADDGFTAETYKATYTGDSVTLKSTVSEDNALILARKSAYAGALSKANSGINWLKEQIYYIANIRCGLAINAYDDLLEEDAQKVIYSDYKTATDADSYENAKDTAFESAYEEALARAEEAFEDMESKVYIKYKHVYTYKYVEHKSDSSSDDIQDDNDDTDTTEDSSSGEITGTGTTQSSASETGSSGGSASDSTGSSEAFAGTATGVSQTADSSDKAANSDSATCFKSDGLNYKIVSSKSMTVKVTGPVDASVKKVSIPDTVKSKGKKYKVISVGTEAFKNCKKLKSVTIGKNVSSVESGAFAGCKALKDVKINSSKLKKIASNAFKSDSRLKGLTLSAKKYKAVKAMFRKAVRKSGSACVKVMEGNTGRFCLFISL